MMADDGVEVGFHGEYLEIVPDERIVSTEVYEGLPAGVSAEDGGTVNTATFTEVDGRTTLTLLIQAANKTSRDAIIDSGMEGGLQDALDLLQQVANSLRSAVRAAAMGPSPALVSSVPMKRISNSVRQGDLGLTLWMAGLVLIVGVVWTVALGVNLTPGRLAFAVVTGGLLAFALSSLVTVKMARDLAFVRDRNAADAARRRAIASSLPPPAFDCDEAEFAALADAELNALPAWLRKRISEQDVTIAVGGRAGG